MKKWMAVILSVCLLAGCGGTGHDEKNPSEQLTITNTVELDSVRADMSGYSWLEGEVGDFEQITLEESVRLFAENGTGVIYYGYVSCPWCERALPQLNTVMVEYGLPAYYVDASVKPEDDTYDNLLKYVGDDLKKDEETGEPVFYVPYVVGVKNGKVVASQIALVPGYEIKDTTDPNDQMNDAQKAELRDIYRDIFKKVAD